MCSRMNGNKPGDHATSMCVIVYAAAVERHEGRSFSRLLIIRVVVQLHHRSATQTAEPCNAGQGWPTLV